MSAMIKILVKCSHCGAKFKVEPEVIGSNKKCSRCGKTFYLVECTEGNEYASKVVAPPISVPKFDDAPYKPVGYSSPAVNRVRQEAFVPSYWALKIVIVCLNTVGVIILFGGAVTIANYCSNKSIARDEIKRINASIEEGNKSWQKTRDENERKMLEIVAAKLRTEKNALEADIKYGTNILASVVVGTFLVAVVVIAFAQLLSCVRDIAKNSFIV